MADERGVGSGGSVPDELSAKERAARGKAVRKQVPLESHAEVRLSSDRDPVGLLISQDADRVPDLVPIRYGRMLVSPFTFYRGAALVMAADLAQSAPTGLTVQVCGDAHLSNFGAYASPERRLVFDINDFDETFLGPFEWDVKRLAASFVVAGRDNGFTVKQCREVTATVVRHYREALREFARQPILAVWYARMDMEDLAARYKATLSSGQRKRKEVKVAEGKLAKAYTRNSMQAIGKLTTMVDGHRRIVSQPPLVVPIDELTDVDSDQLLAQLRRLIAEYRGTLQEDRRRLLDNFRLADVGHKVVGVGSVGTRAWIMLLESTVADEALLLQAKQAGQSALSAYVPAVPNHARHANQGERVVVGQRMMQAASDIFLGWLRADTTDGEQDYYVRQLRDWKMSADIDALNPAAMTLYAQLCGWTLARAHARSGDRFALAGYLGKSTRFDQAITDFSEKYADQTIQDHKALIAAVGAGRIQARSGI
ncbi:DUF2252 domain-containing protein [Kribbella solani]|uniref:Uncharacterized protein (DUF2252 family) n=1 Tax=Kribbella solani TaxID=236067 RepID=A0A841DQT3_9ACTN|nr:DUF2252 domain-containing protein [Kribbella solani]MBB5979285.1 uncharacterized protein (DUF2252 family) [Kribbella solani]